MHIHYTHTQVRIPRITHAYTTHKHRHDVHTNVHRYVHTHNAHTQVRILPNIAHTDTIHEHKHDIHTYVHTYNTQPHIQYSNPTT